MPAGREGKTDLGGQSGLSWGGGFPEAPAVVSLAEPLSELLTCPAQGYWPAHQLRCASTLGVLTLESPRALFK